MNRLDRISALLVWLQSRSTIRAADAARRFEVSIRTIYRDMRTLEQAGVPICGDAGVGYSLVEGYRLPPLMFTPQEAMAFLTAEKFVEQLTDSHNSNHFRSGMEKIRAVMRGIEMGRMNELSDSIWVSRSPYAPRAKRPDLIQTILQSIGERKILLMEYTTADSTPSMRRVEAVGVGFSHPYWYLTAWCHLRGEYRTFRLDRIDKLETTDAPHTIAQHPPLTTFYEESQKPKTMTINSIEIQNDRPAIATIAMSHTGHYAGIGHTFQRMGAWAAQNNYWGKGPRMLGVYQDDPSVVAPDKLRSKACLEEMEGMTPGAGMERYTISGGKFLVMNATLTMSQYTAAWQKIYQELAERSLREDDRDHYELYLSCVDATQGDDAPWMVEFCVPVK